MIVLGRRMFFLKKVLLLDGVMLLKGLTSPMRRIIICNMLTVIYDLPHTCLLEIPGILSCIVIIINMLRVCIVLRVAEDHLNGQHPSGNVCLTETFIGLESMHFETAIKIGFKKSF